MVAQSKVGAQIPLTIMRSGKEYALNVTTSELPKELTEAAPGSAPEDTAIDGLAGLNVIELTTEISRQLGLPKDEKGVVVVRVDPGSSVEDAGLRKGDVIQEVDRKKITGLDDYARIVADVHSGSTVLMFIKQGREKVLCDNQGRLMSSCSVTSDFCIGGPEVGDLSKGTGGRPLQKKRHLLPVYDIYRIKRVSVVRFVHLGLFRGGDRHAFYY